MAGRRFHHALDLAGDELGLPPWSRRIFLEPSQAQSQIALAPAGNFFGSDSHIVGYGYVLLPRSGSQHDAGAFDNTCRKRSTSSPPADAFVGSTIRDIIGDSATEPKARLRRVEVVGETPAAEITLTLPSRNERGYWIEKNCAIKAASGTVIEIASLAVEVTADRNLEECFRKLDNEVLRKNPNYHRLFEFSVEKSRFGE